MEVSVDSSAGSARSTVRASTLSTDQESGFNDGETAMGSTSGTQGHEVDEEDQLDNVEDGPNRKKQRLPRIAEACIRCKTRKQRCVRDGPGSCRNCAGVNTECIIAPRARRKNARQGIIDAAQSSAKSENLSATPTGSPRLSAPSPCSLQRMLRNDPPSSVPTSPAAPYITSEAQGQFPTYSTTYQTSTGSMTGNEHYFPPPAPARPPYAPPPPSQSASWPYYSPNPALIRHSPSTTAPPLNLSAPTSDVRSSATVGESFPLSPPSVSSSGINDNGFAPSLEDRPNANGKGRDEGTEEASDRGEEGVHDEAARGVAFLSLHSGGAPIYVGPSSGFSWAKMILGGMAGAARAEGGKYTSRRAHVETHNPFETGERPLTSPPLADDALADVSDELADHILGLTYRHIQSRYPFIDWIYLHSIWPHRNTICKAAALPDSSTSLKTAAFFVWMQFAIGSRLARPLPNLASSESYYTKAMEYLETIVGLHDLKNVQALLLMTMYSFRAAEAPSTWFLVGIIIRLCCSLGLHRRLPPSQARRVNPYVLQMRRRIFWTAYLIDRMLAVSLGRPTSIHDHDIDIEYPLDYDCVDTVLDLSNPPSGPTSMSSSIHYIKLMRLMSDVRHNTYRVDKLSVQPPEELLEEISRWENQIPPISGEPTCWQVPCCTNDWFLARAADLKLYLLRPLTADARAKPEHLRLVAQFSAEACEIQKRLHQTPTATLSLEVLRTVFLNGLTLLHSVRLDRHALSFATLQRAVRACSNTLYAYSQQFPGAAAYSEVFDELSGIVLDRMSSDTAPNTLPPSVGTPLFQSLWDEIPSMMTTDTEDSFTSLLESLGVPTESLGNTTMYSNSLGLGMNDLSYCTSTLEFEPFAIGNSGGGLW